MSDKENNPAVSFSPITDYNECNYAGSLNLVAPMGDPTTKHINESWVADDGELTASIEDP